MDETLSFCDPGGEGARNNIFEGFDDGGFAAAVGPDDDC